MAVSELPANLAGKAVQVEHRLYDELWNSGDKKIPEMMMAPPPPAEEREEEEGAVEGDV
jgi:hypothetical protein